VQTVLRAPGLLDDGGRCPALALAQRVTEEGVMPVVPRGGYTVTFNDVKPAKINQFDNYRTFDDNVGGGFNRFNGVDVSVSVRLKNLTIQGGTSSGNVIEDECGVSAAHPETLIPSIGWGGTAPFFGTFLNGLGQWPIEFCHRESG
jgi:hypothetical protein